MDLVDRAYAITRSMPPDERYGLSSQIQRAAVSVAANIAEGQARHHPKEFFRHLSIARGSLAELDTLIQISVRLGYTTSAEVEAAGELTVAVRQLLQRLMQSIAGR